MVMFFGLTNSPATFQTMMNDIFHVEVNNGQVLIYLDDILIFSKDLEAHHQQVRRIMQILRENRLYLKPEKCQFDALETEYLCMIISEGNIRMDPIKIAGIAEWVTPSCKREVQQFLGFFNFYRHFIESYSQFALPLTSLTGNAPFIWAQEQEDAFNKLKSLITAAPVLAIPNHTDPFRLATDASAFATAIVSHKKKTKNWS